MEIIRIPNAYHTQIQYLNKEDSEYVLKTIFALAYWEDIKIENSLRWWLVISIWREAIQMENKARAKKWEKRLNEDIATLTQPLDAQNTRPIQIKSSQVKSSQVKSNQENMLAHKNQKKFKDLIKEEFTEDFIKDIFNTYEMSIEEYREECETFIEYREEKKPWWKKERWEMEKTFDPKLRFRKWMRNNNKWKKRIIVNPQEDEKQKKLKEIENKKRNLYNNN